MDIDTEDSFIKPIWPAPAHITAYTTTRIDPLPHIPIKIKQIHSDIVLPVMAENQNKEADALWTDQLNQVCAVITADCLPVLLTNRQGTHVAAIHAGWRGLAKGIIPKTVQKLNLPSDEIIAWLGPAISQPYYEVGEEVRNEFLSSDPDTACAFMPSVNQRWLLDLYMIARLQLEKKGVSAIYGGEYCTFSQPEKFFSYRRDGGIQGHMATVIWISYNQ